MSASLSEQHRAAVVTADNALFIDLVQIRADGVFGTGLLVGLGLVLTARHCVCDPKDDWRVRSSLGVYLFEDLQQGLERHLSAEVIWPPTEALSTQPADVAILRIAAAAPPSPLGCHTFGELPRIPITGSARGFPALATGALPGGRIEHDQPGRVTYTSLTRRALTIDMVGPHDLKGTQRWAGLSGGPLYANGAIVGVMRQVPDGWQGEAIEAEPLAPLLRGKAGHALRALLGITRPLAETSDPVQAALSAAYGIIGTAAFAASERTFTAAVATPSYGRAGDLSILDEAVASYDRGILLVHGEAGLGKTRLAALWAEQCRHAPRTTVLRHAFSVREPAAGTRAAMTANLVRQAADWLGPAALGGGEPGGASLLEDRLATLLAADRTDDDRLIVILDGLDEAAEPIDRWELSPGHGVFILATCRTKEGDEPLALRRWRERAGELDVLALHHKLQSLDVDAIADWLTAATGRPIAPTDPLVVRAMQASEGVPLFASFLIPAAIDRLQAGETDPFPDSFGSYAQKQLSELRDELTISKLAGSRWEDVRNLFALLSIAKAPLAGDALDALGCPLPGLDQRAERWLWRRTERSDTISFSHPRLAAVFRTVLPTFKSDILVAAAERLVEACSTAWGATGRNALQLYALQWLPAHLVDLDQKEDAASLLSSGTFLRARFTVDGTTVQAHATASETIQLGAEFVDTHPLAEWRRFWIETEARVAAGLERAGSLGITTIDVFTQLVHDRLGPEAMPGQTPAFRQSSMRLTPPCQFRHPNLLRSFDAVHAGGVLGALMLADGLVSWGEDGALRFWSLAGAPRPGGDPQAHTPGVKGVLALANGLVSWGEDGALRFWSLAGAPRPGGVPQAHAREVRGVLGLADGLVSWGEDGALRFWSLAGALRPGGDPQAHDGWIGGVLALADRLVSWGEDGALRLWSLAGAPRPGGDPQAHDGWIGGVLALADRLVSWGQDGALRLWSLAGAPGSDPQAHTREVLGVRALADGLVSWGQDGALRFWSLAGAPRPGGAPQAHARGVKGVLVLADGLVSWGQDGALRFWSLAGVPCAGGDPQAHVGEVSGVRALADGLVSWGQDGALRFWSLAGAPQPGGDPQAHLSGVRDVLALTDGLVSWGWDGELRFWSLAGTPCLDEPQVHAREVRGVLALADGLVSWGKDGALRFWSLAGAPRPGGDPQAHVGWVLGVLVLADGLVSWGQDGALRFWSLAGAPRPGGDPKAHDGWIGGVLALADRLISWGQDGSLRLWSPTGAPGDDPQAHTREVLGVRALADGLVSWGQDGALRFWSLAGAPRPGGDPQAHPGGVRDVLALTDGLASWGEDGALRFWSLAGAPQPGGDPQAHAGLDGVVGVLALADGLVSWGGDGALRFWSLAGEPRPGGDPEAHTRGVLGVLALADGLVSWGWDGALRFWSLAGEPRPGGDPKAHARGVLGVLALTEGLVSWGGDQIIRGWRNDGSANGVAWISPAKLDFVDYIDGNLWVGLLGRPHRLQFG